MEGGGDEGGEMRRDDLRALQGDAELGPDPRLCRGRAEADDRARLYDADLRQKPRPARRNLGRVRLLVDTPFAARLPLEMLDNVRYVDRRPVNPSLGERLVEQGAGRSDERRAGEVRSE